MEYNKTEEQFAEEGLYLVKRMSNWGYWDEWNSRRLKKHDRLRVVWPNGSTSVVVVDVDRHTETVSDMGHPWDVADERTFFTVRLNGFPARVYLAGMYATDSLREGPEAPHPLYEVNF